ncbi:MAG: DUF5615 family PIN-like protein, partial [Raineya sp.]
MIDAQLPKKLAELLANKEYDAKHTLQIPNGNFAKDSDICEIAEAENRCVISKTGNISNKILLNIFENN